MLYVYVEPCMPVKQFLNEIIKKFEFEFEISMSRLWLQQQFSLALWDWPRTSIYILTSRQWFRQLWSCYCTYLPPLAALSVRYLVDQPARLGYQFTHIVLSPACITPVKANKYYVEQGIAKLTDSTLIPLLSYFPCVFISWLKIKMWHKLSYGVPNHYEFLWGLRCEYNLSTYQVSAP